MKYRLFIVPLALLTMLSACSSTTSNSSKSAYSEYQIVNEKQIKWENILSQSEEEYVVFFYSETCSHCHEMMNEIISFATDNIEPTYFLDVAKNEIVIQKVEEIKIGIDDINEFGILGTPTLVEIKEGKVAANIGGLDPCLSFMNEKRLQKD